ncbi:MAG: MBL fold metallo-hydrolase [Lachnospiraceae bacterium]|nr:MBL fold metallo-hydrolase [Lachnospiraceae bacterium]
MSTFLIALFLSSALGVMLSLAFILIRLFSPKGSVKPGLIALPVMLLLCAGSLFFAYRVVPEERAQALSEATAEEEAAGELTDGTEAVGEEERGQADGSETETVPEGDAVQVTAPESGNTTTLLSPEQFPEEDSPWEDLQVHYIDVGQGDATLILCGGESMLIDAGSWDKIDGLRTYLKNKGVSTLKYVIGTHPDPEHMGSLDVILKEFECKTLILPEVSSDAATYKEVLQAAKDRGYPITNPVVADKYKLGDAEFTILAPRNSYSSLDDYSVVFRLTHGDNSFLFTGDAQAVSEGEMIWSEMKLGATVLKVANHGDRNSTTEEFLKKVNPAFAVISCGKDNLYGHPSREVLKALQERNVQTFRTDEQGTIVAISDGREVTFDKYSGGSWNAGVKPEKPTVAARPSYVLNGGTKEFHASGCTEIDSIGADNKIFSETAREELIKQGFKACEVCAP